MYMKTNSDLECEVGDIFEYPETGEYEKLRGDRIVVLEKGKGCNPDHTYTRVLCFRPNAENDSFHFSCNDRYMDKVLEHWRFVGHMDISQLVGGKESNEPDYTMMLTAYSLVNASNLRHELAAKESENADLKNENAFLTHKLREAEAQRNKVKNERDDLEKEIEKLMQKISCADKLLAEAADRLYKGRAHFDMTAHN